MDAIPNKQEIRDIPPETIKLIQEIRLMMEKEHGFKPSVNATLKYILSNGSILIINFNKKNNEKNRARKSG